MIAFQHGSSLHLGGAWCVLAAEGVEEDGLLLEVVHVVSEPEFVVVEVKLRLSGSSAVSSADGCIATAAVKEISGRSGRIRVRNGVREKIFKGGWRL